MCCLIRRLRVLISVIQFTFDPRLSQPLDYMDSCAPSTKVSLLWRLSIVVRGHRMANNARWHSEKVPPRVTGTSRHDSERFDSNSWRLFAGPGLRFPCSANSYLGC